MAAPAAPRARSVAVGAKLILMSFASGCMDILSYRQLGHVFTSAMTGNAALLGLDLGQGKFPETTRNLAAFAGFLIGLGVGAVLLRRHPAESGCSRVTSGCLLAEEALLIAFAAMWYFGAGPSSNWLLYGLIALSAIAMGMQSSAAQRIGVPGVATTYFTGTLTKIVLDAVGRVSSLAGKPPSGPIRWPASAFLGYIAGAALTGFLELQPKPLLAAAPAIELPALPAIAIAVVLIIALADEVSGARRARQAKTAKR
ncbi:YoaK family protein [Rhodopila sp.]|uniref:YoaK family protein n=1 Tax=Rhodopila sp. TaxID=2480087 RepID=UPI003D12113C